MDALSDVLRVAHLTGGVFLHADFFAPWCMAARVAPEHCAPALGPASNLILYHYIVEGELRIRVDGDDEVERVLRAGDVVLLPRNDLHLVGSDLTLRPVLGSDIIQPPKAGGLFTIHHGGGGKRTRMICGYLGHDSADENPVISTLPPLLKFDAEQGGAAEWIRSTFNMLRKKSLPAARVRRPCWRSYRSCCSSKPCVATLRRCRRGRPVGSPVCATRTFRERWRCCIMTSPGPGTWMILAARLAFRVRRWRNGSPA